MDENKITSLVENIEIFLETSSKNNEKILKTLNDLKNDPKSAQILSQTSERIKTLSDEFSGLISKQKQQIENFKPEVEHRHYNVDVKKPIFWIGGAITVMMICFVTCFQFYDKNQMLEKQVENLKVNDYKYRYFKYRTMQLQEVMKKYDIKTTSDLAIGVDARYKSNPQTFIEYVINREQELKQAEENEALAKLKQSKAREALEESERLQKQADSLKNK